MTEQICKLLPLQLRLQKRWRQLSARACDMVVWTLCIDGGEPEAEFLWMLRMHVHAVYQYEEQAPNRKVESIYMQLNRVARCHLPTLDDSSGGLPVKFQAFNHPNGRALSGVALPVIFTMRIASEFQFLMELPGSQSRGPITSTTTRVDAQGTVVLTYQPAPNSADKPFDIRVYYCQYYYAQWVWICTMGLDFRYCSFLTHPFLSGSSGIERYTSWL
ncbi:hypothetical protein C8R45DRAFT_927547 [Mycena sanguinolenta]|nr:hypothetical protein C8R45DRAFT_927547 [Mycena sanguinolenta]